LQCKRNSQLADGRAAVVKVSCQYKHGTTLRNKWTKTNRQTKHIHTQGR